MSGRHIPYFTFYPADFMNGVRGLSAQEIGVYTMLLCRIYEENGPIEANNLRLATYCGMREKTFAAALEKLVALGKLTLTDGRLSNRRAESEIQKRADGLKNNSKAGKASAEKRQQKQVKAATDVEQPFNHTDTDTDTDKNVVVVSARAPGEWTPDSLWRAAAEAAGLNTEDRLPSYWMPPSATVDCWRWIEETGLNPQQIVHAIRENRKTRPDPPSGPRGLTGMLKRYAAAIHAPASPRRTTAAPSTGASNSELAERAVAKLEAQNRLRAAR